MRELIASIVCVLTASIIILLSGFSASRQSQPVPAFQKATAHKPIDSSRPASAELDDGQVIFEKQGCPTCHSFQGRGNVRSRLDGVANQLSPKELREWITGTGSAAPLLPVAVVRRKANYLKLTDAEMSALTRYLASPGTSTNSSPIHSTRR
jgi:mono/diheme cytochrome c family protein